MGSVKRLVRNRRGLLGGVLVALILVAGILAPAVAPYSYSTQSLLQRLKPPTPAHWLGTDGFGRDILTRIIWGARVSLQIGFLATGLAILVGTAVGGTAGYFGAGVDTAIMRVADVFMSVPALFLILVVVALFGASLLNTALVVGLVTWAPVARIVRGADTDDRGLTPESAGLFAAATGFQATSRDDFDNMARQFPLYDALYAYCRAEAATPVPPRVLFVCLHGAAKSVIGSRGSRPYSNAATNFDAHTLAPAPSATPMRTSTVTRASTSRTTPVGAAPSAIRMPISVRRRLTAYDVTPYNPRPASSSARAPKNPDSIATTRS